MLSSFNLQPAQLADFDDVAILFEALHAFNASLDANFALADDWRTLLFDYFRRTVTDSQMLWLLAWHQHEAVGLLVMKGHIDSQLFKHRTWSELVAIYVAPPARGTGLAQRLVTVGRDWTAERGCTRMQLYVTASNEQARRFYRSCGLYPVQEIWRLDVQPTPDSTLAPEEHETDHLLQPGASYLHQSKNPSD